MNFFIPVLPVYIMSPLILPAWLSNLQTDIKQHTWYSYLRGETKTLHAWGFLTQQGGQQEGHETCI